ncbi:M13 family metallopeptidase [Oceanivirga miroungae]|uniref:Endothelin-converting enzyme 1 n=1 Tax=Oceanivirga miroungae TaxID=1130046 RepID=A0A6I8MEY4_9FUSO|nr:M13 family metallopeptidase [Oceanivirga miroungae]VWL85811.1 endothelin-converting enzyme 1 [Oceanivirga miroungae]
MIDSKLVKEDFYMAVNGKWLETAVIPADRPTAGGFNDLVIKTEDTLINEFNEKLTYEDEMMNEFIKFYNYTKDFSKRDAEGVKGLEKYVNKLEELKDFKDYKKILREWDVKGFSLPFHLSISPDMKDAVNNALYLDVPKIILPDKTYYEKSNPKKDALLNKYREMAKNILKMYGYSEDKIEKLVEDTIKFDELLQVDMKNSTELADYTKSYNKKLLYEVEKYAKTISFKDLFNELFGYEPEFVIVTEPKFFEGFSEILKEENFEILKSWSIVKLILSMTSSLTNEMRIEGGAYGRFLSGVEKEKSVEKYAYYYATAMYQDVVSVYYGRKYFGEKAKEDVREMVVSMIDVYKDRLKENKWLDKKTSLNAIKKLEAFSILVGYPDKYDSIYIKLRYDETKTFFENVIEFDRILGEHHLLDLAKPVDKTKWHMPSNMVNAYYDPTGNLICFPAAILQAPFYSIEQSKSSNYGGIGAVIGHEISHAFDNNGALFDEKGNINNWWTEEDFKVFDEKAKKMIEQFDGIKFGSSSVNGTLTVSENIADAGGLSCSLEALKRSKDFDVKEFFINFARIWCMKAREEYIDLLLSIDVHAPARLRANEQPKNLDEFYEAFDIKEGDKMFMPKEKRVNIW